jgi:hypothetical protein
LTYIMNRAAMLLALAACALAAPAHGARAGAKAAPATPAASPAARPALARLIALSAGKSRCRCPSPPAAWPWATRPSPT